MELFDGDESKVKELEKRIADDFGFAGVVPVSGQTYSRKIDAQTLATLAGIAESASKFATDLRLLQHLKEVEEPFEKEPDRLVRHAVQAQPDAFRAYLRTGALRHL